MKTHYLTTFTLASEKGGGMNRLEEALWMTACFVGTAVIVAAFILAVWGGEFISALSCLC